MIKARVIKPSIKPRLPWDHGSNGGREGTTDLSLSGSAQADAGRSSLATGAADEVSLTGAANDQAVADSGGIGTNSGTSPAPMDGLVNASLLASDPAGNSATTIASAVSPDTGSVGSAPPVTITDGATVEIDGVSAQPVTFTGTTGTLKLDNAVAFSGQVSGLTGSDAIDLADVKYGANTTATFSGNSTGGTLTVSDGTDTAHIALVGDYLKSGWTLSSDGHGGTVVVDPPLGGGYPNATNTGIHPE